jgi:hypothetical protein
MCFAGTPRTLVTDAILKLDASEALAEIQPRSPDRKDSRIPDLKLTMTLRYHCPTAATAESITVSIADTHQHFAGEDIARSSAIDASVTLPSGQMAPIPDDDFCIDGLPTAPVLQLPGIATLRASLRCRSSAGVSIHYASTALPLRLVCASRNAQVAPALR